MSPAPPVTPQSLQALENVLLNIPGNVALHERFRALFTLKAIGNGEAIQIIGKGFKDHSALLKHELAYCLGQIGNPAALPILEARLRDLQEDPMVRHEAAEAMGAISSSESLPVLKEYLTDPEPAVRETCEIALDKIAWDASPEGQAHARRSEKADVTPMYTSVDPAPPTSAFLSPLATPRDPRAQDSVKSLRADLLNTSLPLFSRYRAMFALRNIGTDEAIDALADGFRDESALFKHEIAFVFGQLLSPHSVPSLLQVLADTSEQEMVRHEAAEALGGIGAPGVKEHLERWRDAEEAPAVVRDSCKVAVDMWEYENSDEFQYANGLEGGVDMKATTVS